MLLRRYSTSYAQVIRRVFDSPLTSNPQKINAFSTCFAHDFRAEFASSFPQDLRCDSEGNSRRGRRKFGLGGCGGMRLRKRGSDRRGPRFFTPQKCFAAAMHNGCDTWNTAALALRALSVIGCRLWDSTGSDRVLSRISHALIGIVGTLLFVESLLPQRFLAGGEGLSMKGVARGSRRRPTTRDSAVSTPLRHHRRRRTCRWDRRSRRGRGRCAGVTRERCRVGRR
jgi:hypothetical protein